MDSSQVMEAFKDLLLVLGPLLGAWLQQRSEGKREAGRLALEKDRLSQENTRWAAEGHLKDITQGLKKLGKQMFELAQAVYDIRAGLGIGMQFATSNVQRKERLENGKQAYVVADKAYLEALNEVSVFLTKEEDLAFRDYLTQARQWTVSAGMNADPEFFKNESNDFKKFNETLEALRNLLRTLLAPRNILARLSKEV